MTREPTSAEPAWVWAIERGLAARNRWRGVNRFPDPARYFGDGGIAEAEAICHTANRDLLSWIKPPPVVGWGRLERHRSRPTRGGIRVDELRFDTAVPSGSSANDRVQLCLFRHAERMHDRSVVLFHHPIFQRSWGLWAWFLAPLIRRSPVAIMAAPHHFDRAGDARYPGEWSMNPNPAHMFLAIRQWCSDHTATVRLLRRELGLETTAVVGYSFGAFQSLLLAAAGGLSTPMVSIASTNRYAYGLRNGLLGRGVIDGLERLGIDGSRFDRMVDSLQIERHVHRLRGHDVLYVRGLHDYVDPPPSLERLERALAPTRAVHIPVGHATLALRRRDVLEETIRFLGDRGALPDSGLRAPGVTTQPS